MEYWTHRKNTRLEKSQPVFFLEGRRNPNEDRFFAVTVNVSDCGVCIFTDKPLKEGDVFLVESGLWKNARAAKAIWSKRLGETLFEAGLALC